MVHREGKDVPGSSCFLGMGQAVWCKLEGIQAVWRSNFQEREPLSSSHSPFVPPLTLAASKMMR